MLVNIN